MPRLVAGLVTNAGKMARHIGKMTKAGLDEPLVYGGYGRNRRNFDTSSGTVAMLSGKSPC